MVLRRCAAMPIQIALYVINFLLKLIYFLVEFLMIYDIHRCVVYAKSWAMPGNIASCRFRPDIMRIIMVLLLRNDTIFRRYYFCGNRFKCLEPLINLKALRTLYLIEFTINDANRISKFGNAVFDMKRIKIYL